MQDVSDARQVRAPAVEVLEREQCTCEKHANAYERRLVQRPARMVLGKPFQLAPRWVGSCADCDREEAEESLRNAQAQAARVAEERIREQFGRAGIPRRLRERTFAEYRVETDEQRRALTAVRDFAEQFEEHAERGTVLVLAGRTGTGKGHLAAAASMQIIRAGRTVMFATAREILLWLRASWTDREAPGELEVLNRLVDVDLLVIDEIGVQFGTDAERDQLFGVIDGRYREQRPMILTTNLSPAKLKDVLGDRSFSRLREDGRWIPFEWEDWRAAHRTEGGA